MTDSAAPFAKQGYYFVTFDKNVINKHMEELILYANKIYPNWTVSIGGVSKYTSTKGLNSLRRVPIESKQKWLIEWTLMAVSCLFTANSICCCQNLINVHNFSSLPRGAVTITSLSQVQRCPSHRSTSLLVRHSPPMVVAHQFSPPLARPARWLPPARRLQRMDGERATVLRAASSQLLAYSKRSPAQLKKCFISQIQLKKTPSKRVAVCLWSC